MACAATSVPGTTVVFRSMARQGRATNRATKESSSEPAPSSLASRRSETHPIASAAGPGYSPPVLSVVPIEEPEEPQAKSWQALALSTVLHALVILWLLFRPAPAGTVPPPPGANEPAPQPIALPPAAKEQPRQLAAAPPPPPAPQTPPPRDTPLGPDSKHPDALVPKEAGPEKPLTEPDPTPTTEKSEEAAPPKVETPPDPQPSATPPEQVSRRIPRAGDYAASTAIGRTPTSPWGPTQPDAIDPAKGQPASSSAPAVAEGSMGRVGLGARDNRNWRPSFPEAAGKCVPIPDLGKNADGTPVLATVIGRVIDTDGRTPLAGAHLQIVGTPFTTFSDNTGEYRLEFDPKLLEACRVQYVRVVAQGYSSQLLTLSIGQRIRSDDVILRKH